MTQYTLSIIIQSIFTKMLANTAFIGSVILFRWSIKICIILDSTIDCRQLYWVHERPSIQRDLVMTVIITNIVFSLFYSEYNSTSEISFPSARTYTLRKAVVGNNTKISEKRKEKNQKKSRDIYVARTVSICIFCQCH